VIPRAAQGFRILAQRWLQGAAPIILLYHRVADVACDPWGLAVHPERFAEQIDILTRTRRVVHLHEILAAEERRSFRDKPLAAVTFDDGYHDVYTEARRILALYNCPMTLFLATGAIGATNEFWWDVISRILLEIEALPPRLALKIAGTSCSWSIPPIAQRKEREKVHYEIYSALQPLPQEVQTSVLEKLGRWSGYDLPARPSHRIMTKQEVANISDGLVAIGAHTVTHPRLSAHSFATQHHEIAESRRVCEELIGKPVTAFAYPFGDYDDASILGVRSAGFKLACTVQAGIIGRKTDRFRLPRVYIADWNGDEFQKRLAEDPFP
jgi:peptidoglycan/xylan/chitin deacetylase (PgdA/CDA1 family)